MEDETNYLDDQVVISTNRRGFLSAALATVTVAAVTGGAAALLLEDDSPPLTPAARTALPVPTPAVATGEADASYLPARLAALEAENKSLQSNLSAAQRQLASYGGSSAERSSDGDQDWQRQVEQARAEAGDLAGRLGAVQGLLTLYEELDAVDLAAAATAGVAAVGGVLGDLVADAPSVAEGLQAGRRALEEFEEQLPLIEQGRGWLEDQMATVRSALGTAERALDNAGLAGGTFLSSLNRWFEDILKWLPFGIGERALTIMSAVSDLMAEIPETLEGLQDQLAGPLDLWLKKDGDETRLQRRLIKPVREQVFDPADVTVELIGVVNERYETQLQLPVTTLVERQRLIREQIAQYRASHAL